MAEKNKKPSRPCFICGTAIITLSRHLQLTHGDHPDVKAAMILPKKEKDKRFREFKKMGIFKFNVTQLKENASPNIMREHRNKGLVDGDDNLVMCSECRGFFCKSYKARHQRFCGQDKFLIVPILPVKKLAALEELPEDFKKNVLGTMLNDNVGTKVKGDKVILLLGWRLYNGKKCMVEKKHEVEKWVRRFEAACQNLHVCPRREKREV